MAFHIKEISFYVPDEQTIECKKKIIKQILINLKL